MAEDIFIGGVPFLAVGHHDGRFIRAGGLFAFARYEPSGQFTVYHLELATAINQVAGPGHPSWSWALSHQMDALLVHLFGRAARLPTDATPELETVFWHPEAHIALPDFGGDASEASEIIGEVSSGSLTAGVAFGQRLRRADRRW